MAILFKSTKNKKRMLFWGISMFAISLLLIVFLTAFPIQGKNQNQISLDGLAVPIIKINFDIINSEKVKELKQFSNNIPESEGLGRIEPFLPY